MDFSVSSVTSIQDALIDVSRLTTGNVCEGAFSACSVGCAAGTSRLRFCDAGGHFRVNNLLDMLRGAGDHLMGIHLANPACRADGCRYRRVNCAHFPSSFTVTIPPPFVNS